MAGEHRHPAGVVSDQVREAAPDLDRGVPVVGESEDAARVLAPGAHQEGDAVHEHPGLAGAGTGEHQHVHLLPVVGDDSLLGGVVQALDDGPPRLGRSLAFDLLVPIRQPTAKEVLLPQAEVVHGQMQGVGRGLETAPGVLHHHMDLRHLPLVVELEGLEVRGGEAAPRCLLFQLDGHRGTEHGETLVQADNFLFVQPEQRAVKELVGLPHPTLQHQVVFECDQQSAEGGLRKQVRPPAAGRQAGEQVLQKTMRPFPPQRSGLLQRAPGAQQLHAHRLGVGLAHPQAAAAAALAAAVDRDAAQDAPEPFGQRIGLPGVPQGLRGDPQMQRGPVSLLQIRRRGTQMRDEGGFQTVGLLQPLPGAALDPRMDECGQSGVVAGNAEPLQVVQGGSHAFRAQAGDAHQLVGGDALVRVGVDQRLGNGQELAAVVVRDGSTVELRARLLHRAHSKRRRKHLRPVLFAGQQNRLLQPGDSGSHPGVVGGRVPLERVLVVLTEDLAGSGDHLAAVASLPVEVA